MGREEYLIDTNIAIAYLDNTLPEKGLNFVGDLPVLLSVISRIELLGWFDVPPKSLSKIGNYINGAIVYSLDEQIVLKTIELRQMCRIKTPDAIIAATAIINDFTLLTRNLSDFNAIPDLTIFNPFDLI